MKKLLALLLAAIMVFTFAACAVEDVRGSYRGDDEESTAESVDKDEDEDVDADADADADDSQVESTEKQDNESFSMGVAQATVYENDFLGLAFDLPSDWTFSTDEQIREMNSLTGDMAGDEVAQLLEDADMIYDMCATSSNGVDNASVILQNVGSYGTTQEGIRKGLETSIQVTKQGLENMGYTNVNVSVEQTSFCEQTVYGLSCTAEINGVTMYQTQACFAKGKYIVAVTATTFYEDTTGDILDNFYMLNQA